MHDCVVLRKNQQLFQALNNSPSRARAFRRLIEIDHFDHLQQTKLLELQETQRQMRPDG